MTFDISFYKGKKVLVTGHTGFKGTWMCRMLVNAGAIVTGYSLEPPTNPNLFNARYIFTGSEGAGAKVRVREEKNPDHRLRPPNDR